MAAGLALGVALGAVAWEAYAASAQTREPVAPVVPAALPARTEPNAPVTPVVTHIPATAEAPAAAPHVDAIPVPQAVSGPRNGIEFCPPASEQAVSTRPATASIKSQLVPTGKPSPAPEPEFNEDF
ncbi:MAG: hypothetical protein KIS92_08550 [Planctomycetota bacterium]|nr:hypothetical protein [Planctomycetota bacterium]